MASELRVNTLKDASGNNSVATSVVFNGTGKTHWFYDQNASPVAINSSFNVASITDSSSGRYFPNITSVMSAANFGYGGNTARTGVPNLSGVSGNVMRSTSQYECNTTNNSAEQSDQESGAIAWGDLA